MTVRWLQCTCAPSTPGTPSSIIAAWPGGGQAAGGAPLRHAASVIGVGMEDIL